MAADKENPIREGEVFITRIIKHPRIAVFESWTDLEQLNEWYAPRGCRVEFKKLDVRKGGGFLYCIYNPVFGECWCTGTYLEVIPGERLVYTLTTSDTEGRPIEPVSAGHHIDWPQTTTVTVTFSDWPGGTKLTLHQTVSEKLAKTTGAYPSWLQMLDILEEQL